MKRNRQECDGSIAVSTKKYIAVRLFKSSRYGRKPCAFYDAVGAQGFGRDKTIVRVDL